MRIGSLLPAALLLAASLAATTPARAAPQIVWTLSGIDLTNLSWSAYPAVVSGSFTVDGASAATSSPIITAFNITVSNDDYGVTTYDNTAGGTYDANSATDFSFYPGSGGYLELVFASPLDGSVTPVAILNGERGGAYADVCGDGCIFASYSGQASTAIGTTVPEPASLALLLTGLTGLVAARRRPARA